MSIYLTEELRVPRLPVVGVYLSPLNLCWPIGYVNLSIAHTHRSASHLPVMATTSPVYNSVARVSSPDLDLPADAPIQNESSPLLLPNRTQWSTARSSFLQNNAGLFLVAAAQFFFSAMGIVLKWFNSLDDPVPTLEVWRTLNGHSSAYLTSLMMRA
jgi:hypothetical protein